VAATIAALVLAAGPGRALAQRPLGIDVSHWDGTGINWTNVKSSGVSFTWAKATEATGYVDPTFALNEANARAAGVFIGGYHFARYDVNLGTNGAVAEANHFWTIAGSYVNGGGCYMMPMLDVEQAPGTNYNRTTLSQWVNAWCSQVVSLAASNNIIIRPVIYCSSSFAGTWFDSSVTQWIPWIANWNNQDPQTGAPSRTSPWPTWTVWQYTDAASVPGAGTVDGDVFNGAASNLVATLVIGGPTIISQPQSLTVDFGTNADFSVSAIGYGLLTYQWRFNGTNLSGETATSYTLTNAQLGDAGSYSVIVSDWMGSTVSTDAVLTVNTPPIITTQPQDQVVSVGQTAVFSVGAVGPGLIGYQWLFNGNPLADATNSVYALGGARSTNVGAYSVMVSNYLGLVVSSNAALVLVQNSALGDNTFGQGDAFVGTTNLIAVAAGSWHNLGLRADGTVVAWGNDGSGQTDVPAGLRDAVAIAAGGYHSLAIRADGTVAAWGADDYGQTDVPAGLAGVVGIAAGIWHSVALRVDGTVAAWGDNSLGQINVPKGLTQVTAVAAGGNHTLVLKADGTVVAWGENTGAEGDVTGQSAVPLGLTNVVAIGAGEYHSLAVKADGTVVAWGDNSQGQIDVPAGLSNAVAVVGGGGHSVALGADGAVTTWGADWNGQCAVPPALALASGIAAGQDHTVVLLADSIPVPVLLNPAWKVNCFSALVQTLNCKNYALEYKDSLVASNWTSLSTNAGNGALRVLTDLAASAPRRFYRMRQ